MKGRTLPAKLARSAAYALFLALCLEGSARMLLSWDWLFRRIEGDYDASWRMEWVQRHLEEGKEIYYRFDVYDSTKGWALRPGLDGEPAFGGRRLSSNSAGLRGKREFAREKTPGALRVLVMGDSYTFGDELNDDETYCSLLQRMLPEAEIINMGVHGYGHDQMLILLKEEGLRYRPDVVVLGFVYYDLFRNMLSFRDYAKPRFVLDDGRLTLTNSPVPPPAAVLAGEKYRVKLFDLAAIVYHKIRSRLGRRDKEMKALTTAILNEMAGAIEDAGALPLFIYIPTGEEIIHGDGRSAGWEDFFTGYCSGRPGLACTSLKQRFLEAYREGQPIKFHGHWGPLGHVFIAQAVCRSLAALPRLHGVPASSTCGR